MLFTGLVNPTNCPVPWGSRPHIIHGFLGPQKSVPKRHLDRFSRFCTVHQCNQHTDTQTTLRVTSIAIGRICATRLIIIIMIVDIFKQFVNRKDREAFFADISASWYYYIPREYASLSRVAIREITCKLPRISNSGGKNAFVTHAGCIAAGVGGAFSRVCLFVSLSVCLYVCPRSKRKTAWSINTELGTYILYSSRSACIDQEVKRSKGQGHTVTKAVTVARVVSDACCYGSVLLLSAWICMSIRLPMFSS